jgi:predicted NACHT family NTPase
MPEENKYIPTSIEKVFELLDTKLVSLGLPGALAAVGTNHALALKWKEAGFCFGGALSIWVVIKVGKKLAPKFDQLLDWGIGNTERFVLDGISAVRSDFEGQYLKQQARLCEEFTVEGFNPDRTAIPLLEEVFVPLDLSGALGLGSLNDMSRFKDAAELTGENLSIWKLLARSKRDRKFRQMVVQAKGGMGKTTLLRHVALIYGQRKQRKYRAPKLVPFLIRLRDWSETLAEPDAPGLSRLITEFHVPRLSKNTPLQPPAKWAEKLLSKGSALVMLDGFDEVPDEKRSQVSEWISAQMQEYGESIFILTSRPAGYKDYTAKKPAIPIFVNKFTVKQQEEFIRRWYLCQERCCRSEKQKKRAKEVAMEQSQNLIGQLQQRRSDLGYMTENPLLLNMLVTFHRFDLSTDLPRQRLDLYRGICKLQLEDRPKARFIKMLLPLEKNQQLLQTLALGMVQAKTLKVKREPLLKFLNQQAIVSEEEIDAVDLLNQIVNVGELLVEREPREYEFPHASFQGFFAATQLVASADADTVKANAQLVLRNWNEAIWRETVLLYTAQLNPRILDQVIRKACESGPEAMELANVCLKEYPRSDKLSPELREMLQRLNTTVQDSTYAKLEALLKAKQWKEADQETYRLMITTVGKEEGQVFDRADLENFPCEDLLEINRLWVEASNGHFGFSVQKEIWKDCGSPMDYNDNYEDFMEKVGWQSEGSFVDYSDLKFSTSNSLKGELPGCGWLPFDGRLIWFGVVFLFSRAETCEL